MAMCAHRPLDGSSLHACMPCHCAAEVTEEETNPEPPVAPPVHTRDMWWIWAG